jgi:hypothetical protein
MNPRFQIEIICSLVSAKKDRALSGPCLFGIYYLSLNLVYCDRISPLHGILERNGNFENTILIVGMRFLSIYRTAKCCG